MYGRALSLAERKIIFSQKQGMMKIVGVNTDLSAWILDKPETGRKFPKTGKSFRNQNNLPKPVDTQYKGKNGIIFVENSDRSSDARLKKFYQLILKLRSTHHPVRSGALLKTSRQLSGFPRGEAD